LPVGTTRPRQILVIEDDPGVVEALFGYLEPRGFGLDVARDGVRGLGLAASTAYDAIVVDWTLPKLDGATLIRNLRAGGATVPVLMLSDRKEVADKVRGFHAGADDYLTKPFALEELEVRLASLIARARGRPRPLLRVGDLHFDVATRKAQRGNRELHLYSAIASLLESLMRASPSVVPRQTLEEIVWGETVPDRDLLRAHIYELRKRVDGPFADKLIHTVTKYGYRIAVSNARAA
jgi:DNA-binding response OmpR family regulator